MLVVAREKCRNRILENDDSMLNDWESYEHFDPRDRKRRNTENYHTTTMHPASKLIIRWLHRTKSRKSEYVITNLLLSNIPIGKENFIRSIPNIIRIGLIRGPMSFPKYHSDGTSMLHSISPIDEIYWDENLNKWLVNVPGWLYNRDSSFSGHYRYDNNVNLRKLKTGKKINYEYITNPRGYFIPRSSDHFKSFDWEQFIKKDEPETTDIFTCPRCGMTRFDHPFRKRGKWSHDRDECDSYLINNIMID